jgi:glutamate/tyrosine decarboxylase-like PLP-dependent enzyme
VRERVTAPLPRRGEGAEAAWRAFEHDVQPWPLGAAHPRFGGWVAGDGTPIAALASLLAAADHSSVAGFDCAATLVEEQTVAWLRELLGFPAGGFGLLTSGASLANLTGLAIARHVLAEHDVNAEGVAGAPRPMVVYASGETHGSVRRALELMGMGRGALHAVAIDERRRMRTDELVRAIAADRAAGRLPAVVVGNAGTVSTGAVDDLDALADVCARERLWFHVDGAIGAPAWLAEEGRTVLAGMQRADSLAFDLHKWLFMPFGTGCILFRSEREAHAAFADGASYLTHTAGGPRGHARWFGDLGPELTRPNRALPVWMALRAHGADAFAAAIAKNFAQARHLERRIADEPELELAAPVMLNVVAFRYVRCSTRRCSPRCRWPTPTGWST